MLRKPDDSLTIIKRSRDPTRCSILRDLRRSSSSRDVPRRWLEQFTFTIRRLSIYVAGCFGSSIFLARSTTCRSIPFDSILFHSVLSVARLKTVYKYSRMLIILLLVFPINLLCFTMWPTADLTLIGYGLCYRTGSTKIR